MPRDISFLFASEIRFCSLLIGVVQVMWSMLGITGSGTGSLFVTALNDAGLGMEWFFSMLVVGVIISAGAVLPWRSGRHIGLFLGALTWFSLFGVFVRQALMTPVVVTMPIFGAFCVMLMYTDAKRKRREKLVDR